MVSKSNWIHVCTICTWIITKITKWAYFGSERKRRHNLSKLQVTTEGITPSNCFHMLDAKEQMFQWWIFHLIAQNTKWRHIHLQTHASQPMTWGHETFPVLDLIFQTNRTSTVRPDINGHSFCQSNRSIDHPVQLRMERNMVTFFP